MMLTLFAILPLQSYLRNSCDESNFSKEIQSELPSICTQSYRGAQESLCVINGDFVRRMLKLQNLLRLVVRYQLGGTNPYPPCRAEELFWLARFLFIFEILMNLAFSCYSELCHVEHKSRYPLTVNTCTGRGSLCTRGRGVSSVNLRLIYVGPDILITPQLRALSLSLSSYRVRVRLLAPVVSTNWTGPGNEYTCRNESEHFQGTKYCSVQKLLSAPLDPKMKLYICALVLLAAVIGSTNAAYCKEESYGIPCDINGDCECDQLSMATCYKDAGAPDAQGICMGSTNRRLKRSGEQSCSCMFIPISNPFCSKTQDIPVS